MRKLLVSILLLLTICSSQAQIVGTLPFTFVNGTTADATQVMANYQFIINQVNANAANNGANSNITSLTGLIIPLSPVQGGSQYYSAGTSTGSANSQVVSSGIVPTGFTLTAGKVITFTSGFTNTGATTFAINGTAATAVKKLSSSGLIALNGGEIVNGNPVTAFFDGTQYNLLTDRDFQLLGKQITLASSSTTDLGTAQTHNIFITGTTGISSFGSSAQIDYPFFYLSFNGSLTLTNSANLVLPGGANIQTAANDFAIAQYFGGSVWQVTFYQRANSVPFTSVAWTTQRLTTGTTYTPTPGTQRIWVRMCGGGGGGAAATTNAGSSGGATTFGGWGANGGGGGALAAAGGAGGTGGSTGTGTLINRVAGNGGGGGGQTVSAGALAPGGIGGGSAFGGGTQGNVSAGGTSASANSCAGGSGGSINLGNQGGGGASGEYVEILMTAAQIGASQTYAIGTSGAGGAAGGAAGGSGGTGYISVVEYPN